MPCSTKLFSKQCRSPSRITLQMRGSGRIRTDGPLITIDAFQEHWYKPLTHTSKYAESSGIEPHTPKGMNCLAGSRYHRLAILSSKKCSGTNNFCRNDTELTLAMVSFCSFPFSPLTDFEGDLCTLGARKELPNHLALCILQESNPSKVF